MIPIAKYVADTETYQRVMGVLESGQLSQGPQVREFEELVAEKSNCTYAVALNNGTTAIEAMLRATRKKGGIIRTSPLTFRATIKAIEHAGMTPVFCDVNKTTLCIDPNPAQFASADFVMPVDLYGRKAAPRYGKVLRDSAQGIGLDLSDSYASAISFYTTKSVGCGEGGAVVTNDKHIEETIRVWRNQGMGGSYDYIEKDGWNWRMTELQAAVAIPQLKNLSETIGKRANMARNYNMYLRGDELIKPSEDGAMVWHQYTLRHPKRNYIVQRLRSMRIDARVYYPELVNPPGDQRKYTPNALKASHEVFSIPCHQHLTSEEVTYIARSVQKAVKEVETYVR